MQASKIRFYNKVNMGSGANDCWLWQGCLDASGYGNVQINNKMLKAHRVAYAWEFGEIPANMQLDHLCKTRNCVNPAHLEVVTQAENIRRGDNWNRLKTHCKRGHKFIGDSFYVNKHGWRICKPCKVLLGY